MSDFINAFFSGLMNEEIQGMLTGIEFIKLLKEEYDKRQKGKRDLLFEAIECFQYALCDFCEKYGMESDLNSIYTEIESLDWISIQNSNSIIIQEKILKKVINVDRLTDEQRYYWKYCIDKTIAEKELTILASYFRRLHERRDEETEYKRIPRILTRMAPLPPPNTYYVTREVEQSEIVQELEKEKKLVLVNGLGGVGKSTVCKELFHKLEAEGIRRLAWIDFNGQSLRNDFIEQFNYPKQLTERKRDLVYFLQNEIDQDSVIFIDNLNIRDIDDEFFSVLESANCCVICTSRISAYRHFRTVAINLFEIDECVHLYKKYANLYEENTEYDEEIKSIVKRVGRHTLTLEILGKITVAERLSPRDILFKLEKEGIDVEGVTEIALIEDSLVGHLCRIFSVEKLSEIQKYILAHFALCPLEQIPKMIKDWLSLGNFANINYLMKYGWFVEYESGFYMHPIIKEVVKRTCKLNQKDYLNLIKSLADFSQYKREKGVADVIPYYQYIKCILQSCSEINPDVAWLFFNLAIVDQEMNNFHQSIEHLKESLAVWENPKMKEFEREEHINTRRVNIYTQIGASFYYLGETESARQWYDKVVKFEGQYRDKELMAQLYSNYALTYQKDHINSMKDGRKNDGSEIVNKAISYFEKTIAEFEKLKKKDEFMAIALKNIGSLYIDISNYQQAIMYLEKALAIRMNNSIVHSTNLERNYYDLAKAFEGLADELNTKRGCLTKYKIALGYYEKCYSICTENYQKKVNRVNLEELEKGMEECRDKYKKKRDSYLKYY